MAQIPDITDPQVRLGIYEKALDEVRGGAIWLCHILPSIWNESDSQRFFYTNNEGYTFDCLDTVKYFPEFGKYYPRTFPYDVNTNAPWRITTLTTIIAELKATINEKQLQA